jgi:hypothetical protein
MTERMKDMSIIIQKTGGLKQQIQRLKDSNNTSYIEILPMA